MIMFTVIFMFYLQLFLCYIYDYIYVMFKNIKNHLIFQF